MSLSKLAPHATLLLLQGVSASAWTIALSLPFWVTAFGLTPGVPYALGFTIVSISLGVYRFTVLGEVRPRIYGQLPTAIRALFLAAPTHAVHASIVALFGAWLTSLEPLETRDEEEREELVRYAFFMYFLLGWTFSSLFLVEKRQQLTFGRLSNKTRLQTLWDLAPTIAGNVLLLNFLGTVYRTWSPLWVATVVSLELGDAILATILTERSRYVDFEKDGSVVAASMQVTNGNPIVEAFQALPLIVQQNGEWQPRFSWLFSRMPAVQAVDQLALWWSAKRNESALGSSITANTNPNTLVALSQERFNTVVQVVYRCESLQEGSVFARGRHGMSFPKEAFRIRAFGMVASCSATLTFPNVNDWIATLNACLDALDASSVRLLAFSKMAALEPEPPRNPDTGLDETNVYFADKPENASSEELTVRKREAAEKVWDERHKRFVGKMWWQRMVLGPLFWNFDPIHEEIVRNKPMAQHEFLRFVERDMEKALLDEFNLLCRASESAVCLVTQKKPASGYQGNANAVVEATILRCMDACDQVERTFENQRKSHDLLYALQFCLERDLQMLRG